MADPRGIRGDDIESWSHGGQAAAQLPELVRRLLLATTRLGELHIPADGGTRLPGWDGIVRQASSRLIYCPRGDSCWEFSVENTRKKIDSDYRKRTLSPGAVTPARFTYVAVTARHFPGKDTWLKSVRKDRPWRDIRLLDADDLATWLSLAPAVADWFLRLLGVPAENLRGLQEYLDSFARRTRGALPPSLLLAGKQRQRVAERVRLWAESSEPRPLSLQSESDEEAILFAAAALSTHSEMRLTWEARALVVDSREALRWAAHAPGHEQLVVLPSFPVEGTPDFRVKMLVPTRSARGGESLALGPLPFRPLVDGLRSAGLMSQGEAERRVSEAAGSLRVLLESLGDHRPLPPPLKPAEQVLLLVSAWAPSNPADRAFLGALLEPGVDAEALSRRLGREEGTPLFLDQGYWGRPAWRWRSPVDAWRRWGEQLSPALIRSFLASARVALLVQDTQYTLSQDERLEAAQTGEIVTLSDEMHEGIAEGIARLAEASRSSMLPGDISRLVDDLVGVLLDGSWVQWASLGDALGWLAEASPTLFLRVVKHRFEEGDLLHLLESVEHGNKPLDSVLRALQTLAWGEEHFPSVVSLLAWICARDLPRDNPAVERVYETLVGLLSPRWAQTCSPLSSWRRAMEACIRTEALLGWRLVLDGIGSARGRGVPSHHKPRLTSLPALDTEALSKRGDLWWPGTLAFLSEQAESLAGQDGERWLELIDEVAFLPVEPAQQLIAACQGLCLHLSPRLQQRLDETAWRARQVRRLHSPTRRALRGLSATLRPDAWFLRAAWLFSHQAPFRLRESRGLRENRIAAERRRRNKVRKIAAQHDWMSLLLLLSERVDDPHLLGATLGLMSEAHHDKKMLRLWQEQPASPLALGYWSERARHLSASALLVLLRRLQSGLLRAASLQLVSRIPSASWLWALVHEVGDEFEARYWQSPDLLGNLSDESGLLSEALLRLTEAGQLTGALHLVEYHVDEVDTCSLERLICQLAAAPIPQLVALESVQFSAFLGRAFERLQEVGGEALDEAACLLLPSSDYHSNWSMQARVAVYFGHHPERFVDLVRQAHPDENDIAPPPAESAEREERASQTLREWDGELSGSEEEVEAWCRRVIELASERGHRAATIASLGCVLARGVDPEDFRWPRGAARKMLEEGSFEGLSSMLRGHKLSRVISKSSEQDGSQERSLALQFWQDREALAARWPRTADLLLSLAHRYTAEAEREDMDLRSHRQSEGLDVDEFEIGRGRLMPLDIVIALRGALEEKMPLLDQLIQETKLDELELRVSLERLKMAKLYLPNLRRLNRDALLDLLLRASKLFPVIPRESCRGVKTGLEATPLQGEFPSGDDVRMVWPRADGDDTGRELAPLHAVVFPLVDVVPGLHEQLALVDVIRVGRLREVQRASELLQLHFERRGRAA